MSKKSMDKVDTTNISEGFKSLFVTNKLDGSEDLLINNKLRGLVYDEISKFCKKLLKTPPPSTIQELIRTLTPPKGVKRKNNIEGDELFDHNDDGPELDMHCKSF